MTTELEYALKDLAKVSKQRAENWPTPYGPRNSKLEARHQKKIARIKESIARELCAVVANCGESFAR
jgi:hypothetical protein